MNEDEGVNVRGEDIDIGKDPVVSLEDKDEMDFFFQAEDGIRDYKVTGVQTCALPIFAASGLEPVVQRLHQSGVALLVVTEEGAELLADEALEAVEVVEAGEVPEDPEFLPAGDPGTAEVRSEERRVGKEGGARCVAAHD